jgi:hypothetical protein
MYEKSSFIGRSVDVEIQYFFAIFGIPEDLFGKRIFYVICNMHLVYDLAVNLRFHYFLDIIKGKLKRFLKYLFFAFWI